MALAPGQASTKSDGAGGAYVDAPQLQVFVIGLFFIFGGITSLNDVIIPKLKELFTLSYTQAMLVQFCFFTAYAVIGIPGARLVKRIGYMRGAVVGLLAMMAGCLLFIPASQSATYSVFLLALFVLASGVVVVQVVANPLISMLGSPKTASSRLTFAQAFNSLGTTIFPWFGSALILGSLATVKAADLSGPALDAYRTAESGAIVKGYIGLAIVLAIVAAVVWSMRNRLPREETAESGGFAGIDLLRRPRFGLGALCIFLYVGAEVSIGSLIVNYLRQSHVMGLEEAAAGKLISLACERLGSRAADGSGIINVAIFGGAVLPLLTGAVADVTTSLALALAIPALCYVVIAAYGWYARRPLAQDYADTHPGHAAAFD